MVTTKRKLEVIIRSRASASPFLIFPASSNLLLERQKGNPTDLLHVSGKSIVGFIHGQKVFAGSNGPLLRTRGIFPYRSRGD